MICRGFFYLQFYFLFSKKNLMEINPSKPDSKEPYGNFVDCKTYLVDGKLKKWSGKSSDVFSNIYTRNKDGEIKPTLLGSIPDM